MLLHPMHTVLVSCVGKRERPNIITLAWAMPTSLRPPMVAVSVSPKRHSHHLIEETKEFVVNVPTMDILDAVHVCGTVSGRDYDKFKEAKLTPLPAKRIKTPLIGECVANLECRLLTALETGDHTIFVGRIVAAHIDRDVYDEDYRVKEGDMVFHLGGNDYATLDPKVVKPRLKKP